MHPGRYFAKRLLAGALLAVFGALIGAGACSEAAASPLPLEADLLTPTPTPATSPTPGCVLWDLIPSPNVDTERHRLNAISVVLSGDVWAVGYYGTYDWGGCCYWTLIEHWDGERWSIVPSPNPNYGTDNRLLGVSAVSADDVWAVGLSGTGTGGPARTLVEHWNGDRWSIVPSPNMSGGGSTLAAVAAVSVDNVWAVGRYTLSSTYTAQTLIMRWDGMGWIIVPSPNVASTHNRLTGVSAVSANDIWAVGYYGDWPERTLTLHWNGSQWNMVPSPNAGTGSNQLYGVASVSANDVWAVGYYYEGSVQRTLTIRWNGTQWSEAANPGYGALNAVTPVSANDVWAVGYTGSGTLTMHWDGARWSLAGSPNPDSPSVLYGVDADGQGSVWATGTHSSTGRTLTLRYRGACGTLTATLSRTGTPPTNTRTRTPTNTRTRTITPTPVCGLAWNVAPNSDIEGYSSGFLDIAAVSAGDVWAVGEQTSSVLSSTRTLTMHWGGGEWSVVPSPNDPRGWGSLSGVAAVSSDDVWAVGDGDRPVTLHWDGTEWSSIPSPYIPNGTYINGIGAASSDDVWVVGWAINGSTGGHNTFILHWDGVAWSIVPSPNVERYNLLNDVVAISANDAWAVGYSSNDQSPSHTLILHWDGTAWSVVPSSSRAPGRLSGVAGVGANDVWAVGSYGYSPGATTLALHWDGASWSEVVTGAGGNLADVEAVSANDVWAAGSRNVWPSQSLVMRWDGSAWSNVPVPNPGGDALYGLAAVSADDIWAAGGYSTPNGYRTLVMRYDDPCVTPTPTATATGTPPTATATRTPRDTPTVIPTACSISFSDVRPTDYFYEAVRYLYCEGVITGYGDGTFRPHGDTTRGHMCKIIVLARGWPIICPKSQTFIDVHRGDLFYCFIETAYMHQVISGYDPCGGCLMFRPNNNLTRGQMSKIVVLAMEWPIDTRGGPHFWDVSAGHAFYPYIETAYNYGVISGYGDGTFRPGNNVTRGQACKVVYGAVTRR